VYALDYKFSQKDEQSIRVPVFNVADPETMQTWLTMRSLIKNLGANFSMRAQIYTSGLFICTILFDIMLFAVGSGFIKV
jgi:hypothetical protein